MLTGFFSLADLNSPLRPHTSGRTNLGKALGQTIGEDAVTSNPSAYNLVTQDAYEQMMNELMVGAEARNYF